MAATLFRKLHDNIPPDTTRHDDESKQETRECVMCDLPAFQRPPPANDGCGIHLSFSADS